MKDFLRIDSSADDAMLEAFITAARKLVEAYLRRVLIFQTWDFWMDAFPTETRFDLMRDGIQEGALSEYLRSVSSVEVPLFPLSSVTYLNTYASDGVAVTMPTDDYYVDTQSEPGRVALQSSRTWPATFLRPANSIQIRFVAGYGADATTVPAAIKQAIKVLTAQFYSARGCSDAGDDGAGWAKVALALLSPYRRYRI